MRMAVTVCRGMLVSLDTPDQLEADGALDSPLQLLDARFKTTELSEVFVDCFSKSNRRPRESVVECISADAHQHAASATIQDRSARPHQELASSLTCWAGR